MIKSKKVGTEILLETDRAFARLAEEKGTAYAFTAYAAESAIKMNDGNAPLFGKAAIAAAMSKIPADAPPLRWEPLKAEISMGNDLGYTFGKWSYDTGDTTLTGVYVSIWKKQEDGQWKFVLDGGNSTPDPGTWLETMP